MFILNKDYLETAQTTLAWSLPSVSRSCCLWFLVSLPPSMTFHPHQQVMQTFLVSSDTNFFYHPSSYFNSLKASWFLAKWLLLHKKQLLADLCGLLRSYSSSLWRKPSRKVSYRRTFCAPNQGQTLDMWESQTTESALRLRKRHIAPCHNLGYILGRGLGF